MVSLKKQKGFTLVELLIVIIIIGILATLVIVTFSGVQAKARDSERQTDVNALNSHVQAYYAQHGWYPTVAQLVDATWRSTNTKGLDPAAMLAPNSATAISAAAASTTKYQYAPTHDDATACAAVGTADDTSCTKFSVAAVLEADGSTFSKSSN